MFESIEYPIFSRDYSHSCLLRVFVEYEIIPSDDIRKSAQAVAKDISYTVYAKYERYSFGGYHGDFNSHFYYKGASRAAAKVNALIKEPKRFNYEDLKHDAEGIIKNVQHKLDKEAHTIRMETFKQSLKKLIEKCGVTVKPCEFTADYGDNITYYEVTDNGGEALFEDMLNDIMNDAIRGK